MIGGVVLSASKAMKVPIPRLQTEESVTFLPQCQGATRVSQNRAPPGAGDGRHHMPAAVRAAGNAHPAHRLTRPKPIASKQVGDARYGQARQVPLFQVSKLRRALSSRQSGSRTGDQRRRISLPGLRRAAYSPRRSVLPEIFSVARGPPPRQRRQSVTRKVTPAGPGSTGDEARRMGDRLRQAAGAPEAAVERSYGAQFFGKFQIGHGAPGDLAPILKNIHCDWLSI